MKPWERIRRPSPHERVLLARAYGPGALRAVEEAPDAWGLRQAELDARKATVTAAPPPRPSLEETARQLWRWASFARPGDLGGIPEGWTEAERPPDLWASPQNANDTDPEMS